MSTQASASVDTAPTNPPRGRLGFVGLITFLLSMSFAFAWLIYGYLIVRRDYPAVQVDVPIWLWLSTFVVLVSSVILQASLVLARNNQVRPARRALVASVLLGYLFAVLQIPGLIELLDMHRFDSDPQARLYRMIVMLVIVHAAHVIGGLIYITAVTWRTWKIPLDAEQSPVLRNQCIFWHYLALIWLIIFTTVVLGRGVTPLYEMKRADTARSSSVVSYIPGE